jgi:hypothetical protein
MMPERVGAVHHGEGWWDHHPRMQEHLRAAGFKGSTVKGERSDEH